MTFYLQTARKGDICHGDSGGGFVMISSQSRWVLTGIVSWGVGDQCDNKHYSMFTNVGFYYDWIQDVAKIDEEEVLEDDE